MSSKNNGLTACAVALQRLLDERPNIPAHVGLNLAKITASIVSLEAGFDRGYLKKSRKTHLPLLAQIEACRAEARKGSANATQSKRLQNRLALMEHQLSTAQEQRDKVLAQNLQLWERVRELEHQRIPARSTQSEILRFPH